MINCIKINAKHYILISIVFFLTGCAIINPVEFDEKKHGIINYHTNQINDKVIIFIHGLSGDNTNTWTNTKNEKLSVYWPDLLKKDPQFKEFDILLMGYQTSLSQDVPSVNNISKLLNQELKYLKIFDNYKEIHFIAHSLGGIIIEDIIIKNRYNPSLSRIKSVSFLSTPNNGSGLANLASSSLLFTNSQIKMLENINNNSYLDNLAENMNDIMTNVIKDSTPKFYFSYENKDIVGKKEIDMFDNRNRTGTIFSLKHEETAKPYSEFSPSYKYVKENIINNSNVEFIDNDKQYIIRVFSYRDVNELDRLVQEISNSFKILKVQVCTKYNCLDYKKDQLLVKSDLISLGDYYSSNSSNFSGRNRIQFDMNNYVLVEGFSSLYGIANNGKRIELVHNKNEGFIDIYLIKCILIFVQQEIFLMN